MSNSNKIVIDIKDVSGEFEKLQKRFSVLTNRFMAVALDYKHYIDNTFNNERIIELRDNVIYRLFSSRFHIQLLLQQQIEIKDKCLKMLNDGKFDLIKGIGPVHPLHDHFKKEISSIFDSLLYHIVSAFDFTSSLINYFYTSKDDKQNNLKWTSLVKKSRSEENILYPDRIKKAIIEHDNQFVNKLYGYRSQIIHEKGDLNEFVYNVLFDFTSNAKSSLKIGFVATPKFIKNFSELKKLTKKDVLSTTYVSFWLLNTAIDHITDLLFEIKYDLETIEKPPGGMFVMQDPTTNKISSISLAYWQEEEYHKEKRA
ncbi:MAG: hypothetical protein ABI543_15225 [Ignavibacteria bacterium]